MTTQLQLVIIIIIIINSRRERGLFTTFLMTLTIYIASVNETFLESYIAVRASPSIMNTSKL